MNILGGSVFKSPIKDSALWTAFSSAALYALQNLTYAGNPVEQSSVLSPALSHIQSCSEGPERAQLYCFVFSYTVLHSMGYSINEVIYSCSLQLCLQRKWAIHRKVIPLPHHSCAKLKYCEDLNPSSLDPSADTSEVPVSTGLESWIHTSRVEHSCCATRWTRDHYPDICILGNTVDTVRLSLLPALFTSPSHPSDPKYSGGKQSKL